MMHLITTFLTAVGLLMFTVVAYWLIAATAMMVVILLTRLGEAFSGQSQHQPKE